jgi:hypothetical protein
MNSEGLGWQSGTDKTLIILESISVSKEYTIRNNQGMVQLSFS